MADDEAFLSKVYDMLHIFGDKWTIPVMVALSDGPLRPSEILARVNGYRIDENWPDRHAVLHDSILARSLTRMTAIGLLSRTSVELFPPKVLYALESPATDFLELLRQTFGWPGQYSEVVSRAQVFHLGKKAGGGTPGADEPALGDGQVGVTALGGPGVRSEGAGSVGAGHVGGGPVAVDSERAGRDRPRRGSAGPSSPEGGRARLRGTVRPR